jgi:CPA2 family monovalent cation:H+ antiporter-2
VLAGRTFLEDLALVLGVAALTTVLFGRLRQPVVLGYLLAGLIVGPHLHVPLFADAERIRSLSELGVILVMFSVGLEFSVRRLGRVLPTAGMTGLIQISLMLWLGYLVAQAFGWTARESLFTGAIVAISSTSIVAKVFAEEQIRGRLARVVFGILIVQDLAAVLLLALLTAFAAGASQPGEALARSAGWLAVFLLGMVVLGFLVVPRGIRAVARLGSDETLLVASIGLCFALALVAHAAGYSVALGAFLAGSLVAESGQAVRIERLVRPVRDMFAAVFFVSVGMGVDPGAIVTHWPAVLALCAVVLLGQTASVSLGSFLAGNDVRTSLRAGMSLAQIGEFSFIIAGVGVASGAIGPFLYPVAVAVSAVTAFASPWLIRISGPVALFVDRKLPHSLQTFVALYASWLEDLRARGRTRGEVAPARRLVRILLGDALAIAGLTIAGPIAVGPLADWLASHSPLTPGLSRVLLLGAGLSLLAPFVIGVVHAAGGLGALIAARALPPVPAGELDLALAPRRALVVAIQAALLLAVGVPLMALTQPFIPIGYGAAGLAVVLALVGIAFWRSARDLQAHVRAGAEMIVEVLAKQSRSHEHPTLDSVHALLPGFGALTPVEIEAGTPAVGRTLADLNLRGLTGASAVAIAHGAEGVVVPTGREELKSGDVLALAGTHEAIEAARRLLRGEPPAPEPSEAPIEAAD